MATDSPNGAAPLLRSGVSTGRWWALAMVGLLIVGDGQGTVSLPRDRVAA